MRHEVRRGARILAERVPTRDPSEHIRKNQAESQAPAPYALRANAPDGSLDVRAFPDISQLLLEGHRQNQVVTVKGPRDRARDAVVGSTEPAGDRLSTVAVLVS